MGVGGRVINIGFTGTRNKLTNIQYGKLKNILLTFNEPSTFIHGGCVGADNVFHNITKTFKLSKVVVWPGYSKNNPEDLSNRFDYSDADFIHSPSPHFERNRKIVGQADIVIACPPTETDPGRGGTWMTINYTIKKNKPLIIITPKGEIKHYNK